MSRLNIIPLRSSSVPRGPAGSSFRTVGGNSFGHAPRSGGGSKKGYTGTVAGLRGSRPATNSVVPKGPTRVFPSVNLQRARSTSTQAAPRSLLNRVVGRARRAFGA